MQADTPPVPPDSAPGSGTNLPPLVLLLATLSAGFSTLLSLGTVLVQLKNYRKITLQRFVVRILIMVPIYALSSLISLYSLDLAFFVDAIRDIYEAFVIYCFFTLLVEYLGGERSLIILLHGRPPVPHPWPVSIFFSPMDVSDPYTFLGLKRGILQYVQIKPFLAAATVILKATGTYRDGSLERDSGYTYVSIIYNVSVGLSLYCLAMFWVATHSDLQPFRPMPKFLCVKGIIFFSFWQGFGVSILVALGWVQSERFATEQLSLAIQDTLICFEMPLFAFLHLYAFSYTDYIDNNHQYSGRLPIYYALRDAFGFKDVFSDSVTTVKGTGFSYRTFEPAEGVLHQGLGRDRRVRAGLRYAEGGKVKYWLPMPGEESDAHGRKGKAGMAARPFHTVKKVLEARLDQREGYAPLPEDEANEVFHEDPALRRDRDFQKWLDEEEGVDYDDVDSDAESLGFEDPDEEMEELYDDSRKLEFGDYFYPVVDASQEAARRRMREEEEGLVHKKPFKARKGKGKDRPRTAQTLSYGQLAEAEHDHPPHHDSPSDPATSADHPPPKGHQIVEGAKDLYHTLKGDEEVERAARKKREADERNQLPPDAYDLVVADKIAEEEEMVKDRRRGEPGGKRKKVYRQTYKGPPGATRGGSSSTTSSPSTSAPSTPPTLPATTVGQVVEVKDKVVEETPEGKSEVLRVQVVEEEQQARRLDHPPRIGSDEPNPWG
ncbi:DUF300-domain-containing protein [Meredithblackwellia eburnea MCA 4105]